MSELKRSTRVKPRISYEISSDSENDDSSSVHESSFSSPERRGGERHDPINFDSDETDSGEDVIVSAKMQPRLSPAEYSLRQRDELHQPLRMLENGDARKKRGKNKRQYKSAPANAASSARNAERSEIRQSISTFTARKRANFFIANKDLFLPLLPENNHVQRLVDQRQAAQQDERNLSIPYKVLHKQPAGYVIN